MPTSLFGGTKIVVFSWANETSCIDGDAGTTASTRRITASHAFRVPRARTRRAVPCGVTRTSPRLRVPEKKTRQCRRRHRFFRAASRRDRQKNKMSPTAIASPAWRAAVLTAIKKNDKHMPYTKYVQLATVKPCGRPANRTVVFRGFLGETEKVTVVTDLRSSKVTELEKKRRRRVRVVLSRNPGAVQDRGRFNSSDQGFVQNAERTT